MSWYTGQITELLDPTITDELEQQIILLQDPKIPDNLPLKIVFSFPFIKFPLKLDVIGDDPDCVIVFKQVPKIELLKK